MSKRIAPRTFTSWLNAVIIIVMLAVAVLDIPTSRATAVQASEQEDGIPGIELPILQQQDVAAELSESISAAGSTGSPSSRSAGVPGTPQTISGHINNDIANDLALECWIPLGASWALAWIGAKFIPPPFDLAAQLSAHGTQLAAKYCMPYLEAPPDLVFDPGPNKCSVTLYQPRQTYDSDVIYGAPLETLVPDGVKEFLAGLLEGLEFFGLPLTFSLPGWGDLGNPNLYHFNAAVRLSADHDGQISGDQAEFFTGKYMVTWRADTLISPVDAVFVYVPGRIRDIRGKKIRYRKATKLAKQGVSFLDRFIDPQPHSVFNSDVQHITVLDLIPPEIRTTQDTFFVEATSPGGAVRRVDRSTIVVSDNCDPDPSLSFNSPAFWPVGQVSSINWMVNDRGPTRDGGWNESYLTQNVIVQDTLPPLILAPSSIVTETAQLPAEIPLGFPAVFDLADVNPTFTHDALSQPNVEPGVNGPRFPSGITTVTWTATDASGNSAQATQLVNVKAPGTNNAPMAHGQTANDALDAISFEPVTVTLTSTDPDADPLWFSIQDRPENGFFEAPLFPYFIEDYRVESHKTDADLEAECAAMFPPGKLDVPFPRRARYVSVDDAGNTFVFDEGWLVCRPGGGFNVSPRLVIFDAQGNLKSETSYNHYPQAIHIDYRGGFIYLTDNDLGTLSVVDKFDMDLNLVQRYDIRYADLPPGGNILYAKNAVVDSAGHLFVTDGRTLRVFDTNDLNGEVPALLGSLVLAASAADEFYDMAKDSADNLYVSSSESDRVYKFGASYVDEGGVFHPGELIGWLGQCVADLGDGTETYCDVTNRRSIGFSCTDDTCTADLVSPGSAPGQFDFPRGIAIDPNDSLYVTDYNNLRVQRFTTDGFFAGQAKSACDGSCFILGDFGKPEDISVNSDHFYILAQDANLLHVSETTPITPIDDTTASVTYRSDNNFVGSDSFTFFTSDGLAKSNMATVALNVTRNHRPPVAHQQLSLTTNEDTPASITLSGSDPDFPLDDPLTFNIVDQPAHGKITGSGANRTYVPDPNFFGDDNFTFNVSDGVFTSDPATVMVTVLPVEDKLELHTRTQMTVGLGFQTPYTATVTSPDNGDTIELDFVDWGDGTSETAGVIDQDGTLTGPILMRGADGLATVLGQHVYNNSGTPTIQVCVHDASGQVCSTTQVNVVPAVDVMVAVDDGAEFATAGSSLNYTVAVTNTEPIPDVDGLTATGLVLTAELGEGTTFSAAIPSQGNCNHSAGIVTCNLGSLAPGGGASIELRATLTEAVALGRVVQTTATVSQNETDLNLNNSDLDETTVIVSADYLVEDNAEAPDTDPGDGTCASAENTCTLRAAIQEANATPGRQTIILADNIYTLFEAGVDEDAGATGDLDITGDVEIIGLDPQGTVVHGNGIDRVFEIHNDVTATLRNFTISGGATQGDGGGVYNNGDELTLVNVTLSGNSARSGGGVFSTGLLNVTGSTISANSSSADGGGLANLGTAELINSTISGNSSQGIGGGLYDDGVLQLTHVSVSRNAAQRGGGIATGGSVSLQSTLVADNTALAANQDIHHSAGGAYTSGGSNLIGTRGSSTFSGATNDQVGTDGSPIDPHLGALADNGGGTLTHALREGSPAIDAASCHAGSDQREVERPQGNSCDIGAYEYEYELELQRIYLPLVIR